MLRSARIAGLGSRLALLALGLGLSWPSLANAAQDCPDLHPPAVLSATPDRGLESMFTAYGNSGRGWTGGDGTYSAALAGGREVWMFADTFMEPITPPTRPRGVEFVRNALVTQTKRRLSTLHGGTHMVPEALINPRAPHDWYWMGEGNVANGRLQVPLTQWEWSGAKSTLFPVAWVSNALASFPVNNLRAAPTIKRLPSATGIQWGAWVARDYPYTYMYGVEDLSSTKYMHIARVRGRSLTAHWSYYTGGDPAQSSSWSSHERRSIRVTDYVQNAFSVQRLHPRLYMLVSMDTSYPFSSDVVAYFSCTAVGPFLDKTPLYTAPESGADGTYHNRSVYTYAAHVHPELSSPTRLIVSYDVNSLRPRVGGPLWKHVSLYRPRFVDIDLGY
ncbi:MAG: DUF4185 domain-containing protein [Solirubrobacteraceae bacterium]